MTRKLVLASDRRFSLFSYHPSHGRLLFRSGKTSEYPTRLDVLFRDVRAMELRTWFDSWEIFEVDGDFISKCSSRPIEMLEPGNKIYALLGRGWQGFIVGGIVQTAEDQGDYMDNSSLD